MTLGFHLSAIDPIVLFGIDWASFFTLILFKNNKNRRLIPFSGAGSTYAAMRYHNEITYQGALLIRNMLRNMLW